MSGFFYKVLEYACAKWADLLIEALWFAMQPFIHFATFFLCANDSGLIMCLIFCIIATSAAFLYCMWAGGILDDDWPPPHRLDCPCKDRDP